MADALCQPDQLQTLIEETRTRRDRLLEESEIGRDRLLERHSHDAVKGEALIQSLIAREQSDLLYSFSELLFDRIGLEQEYLDEHLYLVRPTENLATGQLPGLDEDGITATYHRQTALSRDEVTFLTWEHPIISETMAALLGSDIGKASLGTFKHRGVPAGTILLESLYRVECRAPAYLETGQFLDQRPLRMLLTQSGKEVGDKLSAAFLADALQSVPSATSATALHKLRPVIETLLPTLENRAESEIKQRRETALDTAAQYYSQEMGRLTYLQSVNPSIRDEELTELRAAGEHCQRALANTKPVLEGLRVCIAI